MVIRSTTVVEAVGGDCEKELLRLYLSLPDGGDDGNSSDVPLLLSFRGIPMTVTSLTPAIPPTINLR